MEPRGDDLAKLLRDLQRADDDGDRAAFRALAVVITRHLVERRSTDESLRATDLDFALLDRLTVDVLDERPQVALELCDVARQHALASQRPFWHAWFTLLAAQAWCRVPDLSRATAELSSELDLAPDDAATIWVQRLEEYRARCLEKGMRAPEFERLHILAECSFARWAAALGELDIARDIFLRQLPVPPASPTTFQAQIMLRVGEVLLDIGDLEAFDDLVDQIVATDLDGPMQVLWGHQQALAHRLRGRLTHACECFRDLRNRAGPAPGFDHEDFRRRCLEQELDVLALLNRTEEVEALIAAHVDDAREPSRLQQLCRLILARNSRDDAPFSVLELIKRSEHSGHEQLVSSIEVSPDRRSERLHDDIGRMCNDAMLLLQRGDDAGLAIDIMRRWSRRCRSPVLLARIETIAAAHDHFQGAPADGSRAALQAANAFRDAGMMLYEIDACRVALWSLRVMEDAQDAVVHVEARLERLLAGLGDLLSAEDRLLYQLSRWSSLDETTKSLLPDPRGKSKRKQSRAGQRALLEIERFRSAWEHASVSPASDRARQEASLGVRARWLDRRTAVLRHLVLPDEIVTFLVTRGEVRQLSCGRGIPRPWLRRAVGGTLWGVRRTRGETPNGKIAMLSDALGYSEVIDSLPPRIERLFIVPDDLLWQVPFAALGNGDRFVVQRFTIEVIPRFAATHRRPRRLRLHQGLGVGLRESRSRSDFPLLSHACGEVDKIKAIHPSAAVLTNRDATCTTVAPSLLEASWAHFACHGYFSPDDPLTSGLVLDDGILDINHLRGAGNDDMPDLVTLSACWSGNMSVLPGREAIGLPQAFLGMGSRHVIASLWDVDDTANPELMEALYDELQRQSPPVALSRIQAAWADRGEPMSTWSCYLCYRAAVPVVWRARWWVWLKTRLQRLRDARRRDVRCLA